MAKIIVSKESVEFLQREQVAGNFVSYQTGAKYELVMNMNTTPIPKTLAEEATESMSGKEYAYGSLCRLSTGVKDLDGDFPFGTKGDRAAFQQAPAKAGVNLGIYRLKETFVATNGTTYHAGKISKRVSLAD